MPYSENLNDRDKEGGVSDDEQKEEIRKLRVGLESNSEVLAGLVELMQLCEQHINQL